MSHKSRRVIGSILGASVGLVYGLVSLNINFLALPGIPLVEPPLGRPMLTVLIAAAGGLFGLLAAWPDEAVSGILLSAAVGAVLSTISSAFSGIAPDSVFGSWTVLFFSFFPRAVLFVVVAWPLRRVLNLWDEELAAVTFSIPRLALSALLLLAVAGGAGSLSLYPKEARQAIQSMNQLVQAAIPATRVEDLPEPLRPVERLLQNVQGAYTLEWSDNPDLLPVKRPLAEYGVQESLVVATFKNGYVFGCAYTPPHTNPSCGTFYNPPEQ
jgi:hypothetical protein